MFLKLLWVDDPDEALSPTIRRTALYDRSFWRSYDVCPFGIAWRAASSGTGPAILTWAFSPPYFPEGMTIDVAEDGDDRRQPMMFRSLGSAPPIDWSPYKRGQVQHASGLGVVQEITLTVPSWAPPSNALKTIAANCQPGIRFEKGQAYGLTMRIEGLKGRTDLLRALPIDPSGVSIS